MTLVYPLCWRIIKHEIRNGKVGWAFERPALFCNLTNLPTPNLKTLDIEAFFGTSKKDVVIELFRLNGGQYGYYLANLLEKKYYYCGTTEKDLEVQFQKLGIGVSK